MTMAKKTKVSKLEWVQTEHPKIAAARIKAQARLKYTEYKQRRRKFIIMKVYRFISIAVIILLIGLILFWRSI